jgi:formylglycine-generating enzyme required for sulfatase activity
VVDGLQYRFPTEAEWEYAARSGGKPYKHTWGAEAPSGNLADEAAKGEFPSWTVWEGYDDGYAYTAPAASFRPNELGLYDMAGNVLEWCGDWYDENYYADSPKYNPTGPAIGTARVVRGSSWDYEPKLVRTSNRARRPPGFSHIALGFRLAR